MRGEDLERPDCNLKSIKFKPLGNYSLGLFSFNQIHVMIVFFFITSYTTNSRTVVELMMYSTLCGYEQVKCAACQCKVGKEGVGRKNPTLFFTSNYDVMNRYRFVRLVTINKMYLLRLFEKIFFCSSVAMVVMILFLLAFCISNHIYKKINN